MSEGVKFIHAYVGRGRATVAYFCVNTSVRYAIAWCSPKDNFSKKRGRQIASGRLKVDWGVVIPPSEYSHDKGTWVFKAQDIIDAVIVNSGDDAPIWALGRPVMTARTLYLSSHGGVILNQP